MTTTVRARFDGRVFIPEEPVDVPTNLVVNLRVEPAETPVQSKTALQRLAEKLAEYPVDPASPGDASAQHDHYLYGLPKR